MSVTDNILIVLQSVAESQSVTLPEVVNRELILLDSGLDSLGFAILVSELEAGLGYDPFAIMDEPVYPATYGEFCDIYEKYSSHRTDT